MIFNRHLHSQTVSLSLSFTTTRVYCATFTLHVFYFIQLFVLCNCTQRFWSYKVNIPSFPFISKQIPHVFRLHSLHFRHVCIYFWCICYIQHTHIPYTARFFFALFFFSLITCNLLHFNSVNASAIRMQHFV